MLTEICQYLRNWFDYDAAHNRLKSWSGTFTISDGELINADIELLEEQYCRIMGSILNDGVHIYPFEDLRDETFTGTIQSMAIPQALINIVDEASAEYATNKDQIESPYQSESFGGYSYTLKAGSDAGGSGGELGYILQHYAARLAPWRKI